MAIRMCYRHWNGQKATLVSANVFAAVDGAARCVDEGRVRKVPQSSWRWAVGVGGLGFRV